MEYIKLVMFIDAKLGIKVQFINVICIRIASFNYATTILRL